MSVGAPGTVETLDITPADPRLVAEWDKLPDDHVLQIRKADFEYLLNAINELQVAVSSANVSGYLAFHGRLKEADESNKEYTAAITASYDHYMRFLEKMISSEVEAGK